MTQTIRTTLIGLGSVNQNFLRILEMKADRLRKEHNIEFQIVAAADSSGIAVEETGFEPAELRTKKESGERVNSLPSYLSDDVLSVLEAFDCDLVIEASPVDLQSGDPGLSITRQALGRGISVVLANKGPLVLAFPELHDIAARTKAGLAYSATVCGALPIINIGQRDLVAADITLLRGIFNSTSNFVLQEIAEGRRYDDAVLEAQRRGIAEADPSLDVEGWDTANKLVIIANSILGINVTLDDVAVEGITEVTPKLIKTEQENGKTIKLLASAERRANAYSLSVKRVALPAHEFLANCNGWEMGAEIHSDLYGKMYHKIWEREPLPTAAAMLRDAVNLFR